MKKMMVLFAVLILSCLTVFGGLAEGMTGGVTTAFEGFWTQDVFLGDEMAYALQDDGTLWVWDYQGEPVQLCELPVYTLENGYYDTTGEALRQLEAAVFELAEGNGVLYGLNPYAGKLGIIDGEGIHWTVDFDASPLIASYGWTYLFQNMAVYDGALYILADRFELGIHVIRIDLASGAVTIFDAPDAITMCLQGDRLLLVCLPWDDEQMMADSMYLETMNPLTGELTRLLQAIPAKEDWGMDIAVTEDAVYLLSNGVFYRSRGGAEFEALQNGPDSSMGLRVLSGGRAAYRSNGINVVPLASEPANEKLVVRGNLFLSRSAREDFMAQHPEALLQITDGVLTPSEVADRIRSGDTESDVFVMRVDASFGALVDKGYVTPIDDNPVIAASAEKMFPAIRSVLTDGQGRLVAYPSEVMVVGWSTNETLWQKHFGDRPLPATYKELFAALRDFLELEDDDGDLFFDYYDYPSMVKYVVEAHLEAHGDEVRFNDPVLRETLQDLAALQQELRERHMERWDELEIYFEEEVGGQHALIWHELVYSTSHWALGGAGRGFMLGLDGEAQAPGTMYVMTVNPLSTHQELAKAFIAVSATPEMDATAYAILHTDAEPLMYTYSSGEQEWQVSPEKLEAWAEMAQTLRFGERTLLLGDKMTEQLDTLIARYVEGQLTLDRMLEQLDEVAGMILQEQK